MQKDAGEAWKNNNTITDYNSISLQYRIKRKELKQINIGDYVLNIGQGLVFWNGFALGKTLQFGEEKKGKIISSYHGADEFNFMRGAAIKLKHKKIYLTPFYSTKKLDATVTNNKINTIRTSGRHLSEGEINNRNNVNENIIGTSLGMKSKNLSLGIYTSYWHYSLPFDYEDPSKKSLSNNQKQFKSGTHWNYKFAKHQWFGEYSIDDSFRSAWISGLRLNVTSNLRWTISARNYTSGFKSHYANSFGEKNYTSNERGFYNAIKWQPSSSVYFRAYYDVFTFPAFSYNIKAPTLGNDIFVEIGKKLASAKVYLRLKYEVKKEEIQKKIIRCRAHYEQQINHFTLHYRLETSIYNHQFGWLIFQDIKTSYRGLTTTLRVAYFNTPDFNTAIYAYQPNVLYAFQSLAYADAGSQILLMLGKRLGQHLKCWLQLSHVVYFDKNQVGSGDFQTLGQHRTFANFQLQYLL